jgi:cytochrome c
MGYGGFWAPVTANPPMDKILVEPCAASKVYKSCGKMGQIVCFVHIAKSGPMRLSRVERLGQQSCLAGLRKSFYQIAAILGKGRARNMSFETNKIAGAVLGALLFALALANFSDILFSHAKAARPGYDLPVSEGTSAEAPAASAAVTPIAARLASADPKKGEAATKPCQACHNFEKGAGPKVGPPLYGVVDRPKGSVPGFSYSDALKGKGGEWTYADLDEFIANPKGDISGTKMAFAGVQDPAKRADIIDYLHTLSDNPAPLPEK